MILSKCMSARIKLSHNAPHLDYLNKYHYLHLVLCEEDDWHSNLAKNIKVGSAGIEPQPLRY